MADANDRDAGPAGIDKPPILCTCGRLWSSLEWQFDGWTSPGHPRYRFACTCGRVWQWMEGMTARVEDRDAFKPPLEP